MRRTGSGFCSGKSAIERSSTSAFFNSVTSHKKSMTASSSSHSRRRACSVKIRRVPSEKLCSIPVTWKGCPV